MTLFVQPVQIATEVLNEAQNAVAGWRRVLGVLDTPTDVADPGDAGRELPRGPDRRALRARARSPTRAARTCCTTSTSRSPPQTRVAVVGETGTGKTTFAKLLTRLMDPTDGRVLLSGVPLDEVPLRLAALAGRDGAAGRVPVRRHRRRQRPLRPAGRRPTTRSRWPSPSSAWPTGSSSCRDGLQHARSASAASRCRSASASWSRSPAPTSPTPTCSCSTRRPPPSTRRPRCGCQRALDSLTRGRTTLDDRAPAVDRRGRRRGARRRPRRRRAARPARRAGRSRRRLRAAARVLDVPESVRAQREPGPRTVPAPG